jgi:CubicO group peptidase (beta-lactamase class C family)
LRRNAFAFAIAIGLLSRLLSAQVAPTPAQVATLLERELKGARVPGASYAIVVGDSVFAGSYGVADVERGIAMTPDTLIQIGSLTKLMTAVAVTSTLEARGIWPASPVGRHLTGASQRLAATTFHELLSHSSGLRDKPGAQGTTDESALGQSIKAISAADFLLPRSVVFSYSNLGYAVAGAALEQLRKTPFADALRQALLEPLGMSDTILRPSEVAKRPSAVGHRLERSNVVPLRTADNDTSLWPAGYSWSTASDMSRLLVAVMSRKGPNAALSRALERSTTPQVPLPNVFVGGHYGYGLMLGTDRGVRVYEHGGTQTGFSAILRVAPERKLGFIVMTNLDGAPLRRIAQAVMGEALQLTPQSWTRTDSPVNAESLKRLIGVYQNRGTAELAVRDGNVVLILDGGLPMAVSRIGEHRYLARPQPDIAGPEFVLQPAAGSTPAFLHFGLWAYVR